ncbi:unnamed protein product [Cuscuta epithymum]|uniref:Polygalacturonase n=1 Tax=Cuscuta epithymum TaxID=186058 RepID=A0AAV0F936_9ASTE|nr:unnamed protein product [Cuscuta epithymum]
MTIFPLITKMAIERQLYFLLFTFIYILIFTAEAATVNFSVLTYGAVSDGQTDSTAAFSAAWAAACASSDAAVIHVPEGRFLLGSVVFEGPCKNNDIRFNINGVLVAPSDYNVIGSEGNWVKFSKVSGVSIVGGTLDGQGSSLWSCKHSRDNCPEGTTALSFYHSNDVTISGLKSQNSQKFHILIHGCDNAQLEEVDISAAEDSPNTDGIHVQKSSNVRILHSKIGTGDDCISIGPGSSDLWIEDITCGPGHGISIGSLGWEMEEEGVQNVTVTGVRFSGTQNGFRIKTWSQPSNGFVRGVNFQHGFMSDVRNPIIIDQNYCPNTNGCTNEGSGVRISDVNYEDIQGTSTTEVGVNLDCSSREPCMGITLNNVHLRCKEEEALSSCANAHITSSDSFVNPSSCLTAR